MSFSIDPAPPPRRRGFRRLFERLSGRTGAARPPRRAGSLRAALGEPVLQHRGASAPSTVVIGPQSLQQVLAPDSVELISADLVRAGDSYLMTLEARAFPPTLPAGWLAAPALQLDAPGLTVTQRIEPVPDALARRMLERSETSAQTTVAEDARVGAAADELAEQGGDAAAQLRRAIAAKADRLVQYVLAITVADTSPEAVRERAAQLREAAAGYGVVLGVPHLLQGQGYRSQLPGGSVPDLLRHDLSGWAVATGLPVQSGGIQSGGGRPVLWGQHPQTRQPILWDRWQATNPHMVVIGESGAGKTYLLSGLLAQEWALGDEALLVLDPKLQEYRRLVTNLNGAYITLSGRAQYRINPLDLPALTPARLRQIQELDTDLLGERITFVRALIEQELRAQGTALNGTSLVLLERALRTAYDRRGITADLLTFTRDRPTFTDVHAALEALAAQDGDARDLARAVANFCRGTTIGNLFDYPSNIPVNRLLALDLSTLLRSQDRQLERMLPQVVMDFFVTRAIEQPTGQARAHLLLDEAHTLLKTAAGAHTLELIYRIGRSMSFAGTVITQGIADLDGSETTRVLLENSRTKLLLGVNRESGAVGRVAEIVGLNEAEAAYYEQCRLIKGTGALALMLADGQRTQLFVPPWPQTIERTVIGELR